MLLWKNLHLKMNLKLIVTLVFVSLILSACGSATTDSNTATHARRDISRDTNYPIPADLQEFQGGEYTQSSASLNGVKAHYSYGNIQALVDADTSGNVKQGGEGQIVSVVGSSFNTTHQEFTELDTDGTEIQAAAFDSFYNIILSSPSSYASEEEDVATVNCFSPCSGSEHAALIAGRKGGTDTNQMHGIAYNAKIIGINSSRFYTDEIVAIPEGVGADIIAMNYAIIHDLIVGNTYVYNAHIRVCYNDNGRLRKYVRPVGINQGADTTNCANYTDPANQRADTRHHADVLAAWVAAVDPDGDNKTIMVIPTGNAGLNSETGQLDNLYTAADKFIFDNIERSAFHVTGSVAAANIPSLRSAYPALYDDDDIETGRWLAVTAVDNNNRILSNANGCGVAIYFCLAAPGEDIYTAATGDSNYASRSGTQYASSTVAGALAILKGAFPNATPEQLTKLVLETATYLPMHARNGDGSAFVNARIVIPRDLFYRTKLKLSDGTARFINPVYGYGLLNLHAATTASLTASYVTASDNESIGALWADTKLTLSSHFGDNFESVKFGIGDVYGRHFITNAPQTNYAPVAIGLDDYIGNLLGENVQSQKLGGQAQLNYSNANQTWMDLEYVSGKATTKIAFQDSYKINPLSDTGTTTILRANNIRPASTNISMMDVDYKLGNALILSSYLARGEYDTGYKFDELGTDFDVNYKDSHLNIAIGNIREHGQFLGTNTSGAYALNAPSISRFTDVTYGHNIGGKFNIYANYINYETDVDMLHDQFASIDGLQADQYQVGFTGKDLISKDDSLNVALITKLGVTDGALNQNTVLGYTADGAFNNASQSYDLAVNQRHQQFEITYQGKLYQNADKISNFRDNRFFTSIKVDSNLNHVENASQTEIISGINIRY